MKLGQNRLRASHSLKLASGCVCVCAVCPSLFSMLTSLFTPLYKRPFRLAPTIAPVVWVGTKSIGGWEQTGYYVLMVVENYIEVDGFDIFWFFPHEQNPFVAPFGSKETRRLRERKR